MTIYVVEIDGRALVAFSAETAIEAEMLAAEPWLRDEFMVLEFESRPLWDGIAEIHVREALEEERASWDTSKARAVLAGETTADDEDWLAYLVLVVDPTDEALDEDGALYGIGRRSMCNPEYRLRLLMDSAISETDGGDRDAVIRE